MSNVSHFAIKPPTKFHAKFQGKNSKQNEILTGLYSKVWTLTPKLSECLTYPKCIRVLLSGLHKKAFVVVIIDVQSATPERIESKLWSIKKSFSFMISRTRLFFGQR